MFKRGNRFYFSGHDVEEWNAFAVFITGRDAKTFPAKTFLLEMLDTKEATIRLREEFWGKVTNMARKQGLILEDQVLIYNDGAFVVIGRKQSALRSSLQRASRKAIDAEDFEMVAALRKLIITISSTTQNKTAQTSTTPEEPRWGLCLCSKLGPYRPGFVHGHCDECWAKMSMLPEKAGQSK